jgi:hypothetical protein
VEQKEAEERHNAEQHELIAAGDARIDDLLERFQLFCRDRALELRELLEAGHIDTFAFEALRDWSVKPEPEPEPELPALPPPAEPPVDSRGVNLTGPLNPLNTSNNVTVPPEPTPAPPGQVALYGYGATPDEPIYVPANVLPFAR